MEPEWLPALPPLSPQGSGITGMGQQVKRPSRLSARDQNGTLPTRVYETVLVDLISTALGMDLLQLSP